MARLLHEPVSAWCPYGHSGLVLMLDTRRYACRACGATYDEYALVHQPPPQRHYSGKSQPLEEYRAAPYRTDKEEQDMAELHRQMMKLQEQEWRELKKLMQPLMPVLVQKQVQKEFECWGGPLNKSIYTAEQVKEWPMHNARRVLRLWWPDDGEYRLETLEGKTGGTHKPDGSIDKPVYLVYYGTEDCDYPQ